MSALPRAVAVAAALLAGIARAQPPRVALSPLAPPPTAPVVDAADTLHGVPLPDPYRWLEAERDPAVTRFVAAQRAYADSVLRRIPGVAAMERRITDAYEEAPALGQAAHSAGRAYGVWWSASRPERVVARGAGDTAERTVVDRAALEAAGRGATVRTLFPSPDGRLVALGLTRSGDAGVEIVVADGARGGVRPDVVRDVLVTSGGGILATWLPDGSGFVYARAWPGAESGPPAERWFRGRHFLHRLGTPQSADVPLVGFGLAPQVGFRPGDTPNRVVTSPGSRWVIAEVWRSPDTAYELWAAPVDAVLAVRDSADVLRIPWRQVASRDDLARAAVLDADTLWILTRRDAGRGRVLRRTLRLADGAARPDAWTTAVAEREGVLAEMTVTDDGVWATERVGGALRLLHAGRGTADTALRVVPLPVEGTVRLLPAADHRSLWLSLEHWATAPDLRRVVADVAAPGNVRVEDAPFDDRTNVRGRPAAPAGDVVSRRAEAVAADGTRIPVSIVHRRGLPLDGTAPLLLKGYGSFGTVNDPSYSPPILPWLEQGGVFAYAHVRGGGELGADWHAQGRGVRKPVAVSDMIAAAEHLVRANYSAPGRITILGTSAGAALVGNAILDRPELFGAALYDVGAPDEARLLDPTALRNVAEFGDLESAEGVRALVRVSPYRRVPPRIRLPGVLVKTGLTDYNFTLAPAGKLVARLQAANAGDRPVLWWLLDEGHDAIGNTPANTAAAWAFALWQTGHPGFQPR